MNEQLKRDFEKFYQSKYPFHMMALHQQQQQSRM